MIAATQGGCQDGSSVQNSSHKSFPRVGKLTSGLKPRYYPVEAGTTEVVPFPKSLMRQVLNPGGAKFFTVHAPKVVPYSCLKCRCLFPGTRWWK
jgi:hypothetical protein